MLLFYIRRVGLVVIIAGDNVRLGWLFVTVDFIIIIIIITTFLHRFPPSCSSSPLSVTVVALDVSKVLF